MFSSGWYESCFLNQGSILSYITFWANVFHSNYVLGEHCQLLFCLSSSATSIILSAMIFQLRKQRTRIPYSHSPSHTWIPFTVCHTVNWKGIILYIHYPLYPISFFFKFLVRTLHCHLRCNWFSRDCIACFRLYIAIYIARYVLHERMKEIEVC